MLACAECPSSRFTTKELSCASASLARSWQLASDCDDGMLARLEANTAGSCARITSAASGVVDALQRGVPVFVSNTRGHARVLDKRLEALEDEFGDTAKTLASFLHQSAAGDGALGFTEDSIDALTAIMDGLDVFMTESIMLTPPGSNAAHRCVRESSHMCVGIDPALCQVAHSPLLTRDSANVVDVEVFDVTGEPVCVMTPMDVVCTVKSDDIGWIVASVSVERSSLTLGVVLTADCGETAVVFVDIAGTTVPIPLQVRVTCV